MKGGKAEATEHLVQIELILEFILKKLKTQGTWSPSPWYGELAVFKYGNGGIDIANTLSLSLTNIHLRVN